MLTHEAGLTATVAVTESRVRSFVAGRDWITYSLRVNGKADASLTVLEGITPGTPGAISPQGDAETQILSGLLATLLHSSTPRSILVIGWGSGMTAGAALATGAERVRAVELEREVLRGSAPFQPYARHPLRDERLEVIEDDGRRVLSSRGDLYDVIISEPSNPWISGCSNLFTAEFFELVGSRLRPNGRFLQWIQAYEISPSTFTSILAALRGAFGSILIFRPAHSSSDFLIVAGHQHEAIDWARLDARVEALPEWLEPFGIRGAEDIVARLVLDTEAVDRLVADVEPNTDENLLVELAAPRDLVVHRESGSRQLLRALGAPSQPLLRAVVGAPNSMESLSREALERAGRADAAFRPPREVDLVTLFPGADERARVLLRSSRGSLDDLAEIAQAAEESLDQSTGLALLGLLASRWGAWHLAATLLEGHRQSTATPNHIALRELAYLCWDAGLPGEASERLSEARLIAAAEAESVAPPSTERP